MYFWDFIHFCYICIFRKFGSSRPTSTKQLEKLHWKTEDAVNARRSTPVSHSGEWPYSILQAVDSTLMYCYRCTNIGFVNSSTSATPWTACKSAFIPYPPHGKASTASAMGSWAQNWAVWLVRSCLFWWIMLEFVRPWCPYSCYMLCRSTMLSRVRYRMTGAVHPESWSGMKLRIMNDPIYYEVRVIPIATGTSWSATAWNRSLLSRHPWIYLSARLHVGKIVRDFCSA